MSLPPKQKLSLLTAAAFVLFIVSATILKGGGAQDRIQVVGWGGILLFSCITFVRGIFAIRRCK